MRKKIIAACLFIILPVVAACQNEKTEQEKQVEVTENTDAKGGWGIESKNDPF